MANFKSADHRLDNENCVCSNTSLPPDEELRVKEGWEVFGHVDTITDATLFRTKNRGEVKPEEDLDYAVLIGG